MGVGLWGRSDAAVEAGSASNRHTASVRMQAFFLPSGSTYRTPARFRAATVDQATPGHESAKLHASRAPQVSEVLFLTPYKHHRTRTLIACFALLSGVNW